MLWDGKRITSCERLGPEGTRTIEFTSYNQESKGKVRQGLSRGHEDHRREGTFVSFQKKKVKTGDGR